MTKEETKEVERTKTRAEERKEIFKNVTYKDINYAYRNSDRGDK